MSSQFIISAATVTILLWNFLVLICIIKEVFTTNNRINTFILLVTVIWSAVIVNGLEKLLV